jgi:antitoxin component of MazEF toxin-antitoxin module
MAKKVVVEETKPQIIKRRLSSMSPAEECGLRLPINLWKSIGLIPGSIAEITIDGDTLAIRAVEKYQEIAEAQVKKPSLDHIPIRKVNALGLEHDYYEVDRERGEVVGYDAANEELAAPECKKCKCGMFADQSGVCPRCRTLAAMDEKYGKSGGMKYIKRGPGGLITTTDNPDEASRPRF